MISPIAFHRPAIAGILAAMLLLLAVSANSQPRLDRQVIGSGAVRASSPAHTLNGTIGQSLIGRSAAAQHRGAFGFWYNRGNVAVKVERVPSPAPADVTLEQNFPNPAGTSTTIRFSLPSVRTIRLALTDEAGRTVRLLADGTFTNGTYHAVVQIGDLAPGIYFYRLQTDDGEAVKQMTVVR